MGFTTSASPGSGTILQLRNADDEELVLFIYGAPPEQGGADFFDDVL